MEAPKAIEILTGCVNDKYPPDFQDYKDAMQLGNEALKAHLAVRTSPFSVMLLPLPSETQDQAGEG